VLSIFRTNQTAYSLFLLVYAAVLRISYFFNTYPVDMANDGILSVFVKNGLGNNYVVAGVVTLLIVFVQSILINQLANKYRLFREVTLLPGLFYILLVSAIQDFLPLSSILLGNTFLILAIISLLGIFKSAKCADTIFNVGFWLGAAALFYNAFILFLFLALLGLMVLRTFKIKEAIMMITGYLLPFIFASFYFFWQDQLSFYWDTYFFKQFSLIDFRLTDNGNTYYKLIILALFFIMGLFNGYSFEKSYRIRNFINIFYSTLFISGFTFLFQDNIQLSHFLIIATPLSILLTARFLAMSKTTAELIHLFIFIAIMLFQFNVFPIPN